jgi:hypothetical protein
MNASPDPGNDSLPCLSIDPYSLEPRQVNDRQRPVFSIRVRNTGSQSVQILPETELWIVDWPTASERGFRARVEEPTLILGNSSAILRFLPAFVSIPTINSGSFPCRILFHVNCAGVDYQFQAVSRENSVRINGYGGIAPIESIGMGIVSGQLLVVPRSGGYHLFTITMQDLFPIDVRVLWKQAETDWRVESDDGICLTTQGQLVLRQTRAWTGVGIWVYPPAGFPADQPALLGTLLAERCPFVSGGLGACMQIGGGIRAVVAENAEIPLRDLTVSSSRLDLSPGAEFYIRGVISNPYSYPVRYHGPSGGKAYIGSTDVTRYLQYKSFTFGELQPQESASVCWHFKLLSNAPAGEYTVFPYFTSVVYFDGAPWAQIPALEAPINRNAPQSGLSVNVTVRPTVDDYPAESCEQPGSI